jgi:hypothetical protein
MKLRLHHIELCVKDPVPIVDLLCNQFGLNLVGHRETNQCLQYVLKLSKTVFIVTSRKGSIFRRANNCDIFADEDDLPKDTNEFWSLFCCDKDEGEAHIDSVFNVAVEVKDIVKSVQRIRESGAQILQEIQRVYGPKSREDGHVDFAVVKSCCGNVVHTLIQKDQYRGWFLPGFNRIHSGTSLVESDPSCTVSHINGITMSHFDHFTLACRVGETNEIIEWYEKTFGMKRFLTNR